MMIPRAIATITMMGLSVIVPTVSLADTPREPDPRERELREALRRRDREMERAERQRERAERETIRAHREQQAQMQLGVEVDRLHAEIQELRVRELDLRTDMETMELEGHPREAHDLQRELVRVRHELERHQLELDRLLTEQHRQAERRELMRMEERLEYVSSWKDVAFDPRDAVMMATQSMVELHMMRGEPQGAAEALEQLLERVEELGSRTAIRFALKDVYAEIGDHQRAQEHMTKVILENAQAASPYPPR